MRAGVERLSKEMGQPKWFEILQAVVAAMAPYARHGVNVNVDFYSGVVYHLLGVKRDLFVPIFANKRLEHVSSSMIKQLESIRPGLGGGYLLDGSKAAYGDIEIVSGRIDRETGHAIPEDITGLIPRHRNARSGRFSGGDGVHDHHVVVILT